jgi:hypothetical protein
MPGTERSLYERLGGYDAIAAVSDDLLERMLSRPDELAEQILIAGGDRGR